MLDDVYSLIAEVVHNGGFRFGQEVHESKATAKGSLVLPEDWACLVPDQDMCMFFDEIEGEIVVFYEDDLPDEDFLKSEYVRIRQNFNDAGCPLTERHTNQWPYLYPLSVSSQNHLIKLPDYLLSGRPFGNNARMDSLPDADLVFKGFGHGFAIFRKDNSWAVDRSRSDWKKHVRWSRAISVSPIVAAVKAYDGLSALERDILTINRPSGPLQSQTGQPSGGVLDARLPE